MAGPQRRTEISNNFDDLGNVEYMQRSQKAASEDPELTGMLEKMRGQYFEVISLQDKRRLGIATLGALAQHPRIAAFREFVEGWYLSYFTPDAARSLPMAGPQRRLSIHGDNLGNVVQYMQREHPDEFDSILRGCVTYQFGCVTTQVAGVCVIGEKQGTPSPSPRGRGNLSHTL